MRRIALCMAALLLLCYISGCAPAQDAQGEAVVEIDDPTGLIVPTAEAVLADGVSVTLTDNEDDYESTGGTLLEGILFPGGNYGAYRVAMLFSGSTEEDGFDSLGFAALRSVQQSLGIQTVTRENLTVEEAGVAMEALAADGCNLIIIHDLDLAPAVQAVAQAYPNTAFCIAAREGEVKSSLKNVGCVSAIDQSLLLGAILGILTGSNRVCLVSSSNSRSSEVEVGLRLTNAACKLTVVPADAADWEARVLAEIKAGADVLSSDVNALQQRVAELAQAQGIYAVGYTVDAYAYAPKAVVLSVMPDYAMMYKDAFLRMVDGEFTDGIYTYDPVDGGLRLSDWNGWDEKLPETKVDAIDQFVEMLFAGEVYDY